ncbi:MAG: hypothetical protein WA733_15755 [Methylocystis sp.]
MNAPVELLEFNDLSVDVIEPGARAPAGAVACELGQHVRFNTELLESFSSTNWRPLVYDALVVAAAVEFCDRRLPRSTMNWGRRFHVRIPVHDVERWSDLRVKRALIDALELVTGDKWEVEFRARRAQAAAPAQSQIEFPYDAEAVIAYSEGMDSCAVAGLEAKHLGSRLVRVRIGNKKPDIPKTQRASTPFAAVPYSVRTDVKGKETSARSRGFKFALVSAIGAYLINAPSVIVPESGQGALAPAILPVGQAYADYRNHPVFTAKMEEFVEGLFGSKVRYLFPRLWSTKGETLRAFIETCGPDAASWERTRSCWQQSRHISVAAARPQCGVCAACMLRRLSVHAAGLKEGEDTYLWNNLDAATFEGGAHNEFSRVTGALRDYALAGMLHLEHFATLRQSAQYTLVKRRALSELARSLNEPVETVGDRFDRLLRQHALEWSAFKEGLSETSFVRKWVNAVS